MTKSFLAPVKIANISTDPTNSISAGALYYNTTSNLLKFYNGSAWANVGGSYTPPLTETALSIGFSIAGGTTPKTLTVSNTITLAGTDGTTITFPATSGTVATLNTANAFTANQTITGSLTATSIIKSGGTSTQYLMADGTVNTTTGNQTISDTAPVSPANGDLWISSIDGSTYIYYADGTSNQWIEVGSAYIPGPVGPQGPSGTNGATGATGPVGPQGAAGPQGSTGATGSSGVAIYDTDQAVISMQVFG